MEEQKTITEEINYDISIMEKFVEKKKITKFIGIATERVLRKYLLNEGFNISLNKVFIDELINLNGKLIEIDLLLLKKEVNNNKSIYNPEEIEAVFEIKYNSIWVNHVIKLNELYNKIKILNKNIKCIFVTIFDLIKYEGMISKNNSSWEIFRFYYYKNYYDAPHIPLLEDKLENKEGWYNLLTYLNKTEG